MILGITGTNGSGKGAVVEYLANEKGFTHYSVRAFLIKVLTERGLPIDRPHMGKLGDELRQTHGAGYFPELFSNNMKENGVERGVFESIRSVGEAKVLHVKGGLLVAVDADQKIRYERIQARKSGTDMLDFETFVTQEKHEWKSETDEGMNVPKVMEMADHTISNNGTLEELYVQIDQFLSQYGIA